MKRRKTKKVKMVRILGETVRKGGKKYRILLAERQRFLERQRDPQSSYYKVPISELLKSNRRRVRRNEALPGPYYVWMTDKFMSGWGQAQGRLNKYVVRCDTLEQAECIYKNAQMRDEMKNINYGRKLPYFSESKYKVTMKTWDQLGYVWKTGCKWQNEDDYYADPRRMSPNRRRGLRRNEEFARQIPRRDRSMRGRGFDKRFDVSAGSDYKDLYKFLSDGNRAIRKLGDNTYVLFNNFSDKKEIIVKLYSTPILTYYPNGDVDVNFGGYMTTTTFSRINNLVPYGWNLRKKAGKLALENSWGQRAVIRKPRAGEEYSVRLTSDKAYLID